MKIVKCEYIMVNRWYIIFDWHSSTKYYQYLPFVARVAGESHRHQNSGGLVVVVVSSP